ncbi:MAG: selenocysteine-specific translation elongation factor [Burkholderiales bacterium]|nr:selenocysteine-specific translation elongation factor [Burkholderiales bacterium]
MIVATAGHIDHGKTLLVKTLTGVDTDRLPEEKARGISIDLGFAYLPLADGGLIGFVDVPGHERFIRNMLAGVSGIDFALLIVAADDGVMPQTIEHLQILDLLHIRRGAAIITKIDRVDAARIDAVRAQVHALLAPTQLAAATIHPVSAVSGAGMAELKTMLLREAAGLTQRSAEGQHLRYAIDRAFSVAGSGTVVTGTVFNGTVHTGDKLVISPAGREVRVRGIQIHAKPAEQARAGERCALNLTGTDVESVRRGDWVMAAAIHHPTRKLDVRLSVLPAEAHALKHWTPVHLHLATADVTARVSLRRGESVAPGTGRIGQLTLDEPVSALHGDRFILRDQSSTRTIGGGIIIDPSPPAARRSKARDATLVALESADAGAALTALSAADRPVDLAHFEASFNLLPEIAAAAYARATLVPLGKEHRFAITRSRLDALHDVVARHVLAFHQAQPQAPGIEIETLRAETAPELDADVFGHVLRLLADQRKIEIHSSLVRKPGYDSTANSADAQMWQTVQPALTAAGFNPPPLRELAPQLKLKDAILKDFLYRQMKAGNLHRVGAERFYLKATMATLAATAQATAAKQPNGMFTAAQYRDATGIGRTLAIEILESLDTLAITQRVGDARKMRKDFTAILGAAEPAPPPAPSSTPTPQARKPQQQRPPVRNKRY